MISCFAFLNSLEMFFQLRLAPVEPDQVGLVLGLALLQSLALLLQSACSASNSAVRAAISCSFASHAFHPAAAFFLQGLLLAGNSAARASCSAWRASCSALVAAA